MSYLAKHLLQPPAREEVDRLPGAAVLEFGAPWCSHCQGAQPLIEQALRARNEVAHLKIEDGRGQRLGRSYGVKLWPTLVFLRNGQEIARLVRPQNAQAIAQALQQIAPAD
ncbi:MAG: thioredoxin family protein [Burkholderiaceae bacterium]|nr:thioredoxin family protein [Burkholderiaceae bacterium]